MAFFDGKRRDRAVDLAVAVVAFAFTLGILAVPEEEARDLDLLGVLVAAATTLPLLARRQAPHAVFALTTAASSLLLLLDYPGGPPIGPTIALFQLGLARGESRASSRATIALVAVFFVVHISAAGFARDRFPGPELLLGAPLWGVAWVAGDRARLRRERLAELEERAQRAEREAERERRLAVAEERTRISRDLHDSAGHAINVILVEAGAARLLSEKDPQRARRALQTIETVARETLGEIDRLVRGLREDEGVAVEPPPGLAALDTLVQRHRTAGLEVALRTHGEQRPLAAATDQAAYRILQESLTNALRHGTGAADVALTFGENVLELAVTNPVASDAAAGNGHGVVGMRERAHLVGGSLDAGRADGVFRVQARLPYEGSAAA